LAFFLALLKINCLRKFIFQSLILIINPTRFFHIKLKGGLTILKELKIAHHENSVPKKDFFSHFSTLIFEFKAKSDIEK
jgi:hypothetical protein